MVNQTLFIRLFRIIQRTQGQFWSLVAVVSLGIMTYLCMSTTYLNLEISKNRFYEESRFADCFFQVKNAPEPVLKQIQSVPGVAAVNGRIVQDLPSLNDTGERSKVRIVSYPSSAPVIINALYMLTGRPFQRFSEGSRIETIADPQFAAANGLSFGSQIRVIANGQLNRLTLIGTATSPEFTYPVKDITTMLNDPRSFGILVVTTEAAQRLTGMDDACNNIIVRTSPGADEAFIIQQVKELLGPYGYLGEYAQRDQSSNVFLNDQLRQLRVETRVIPAIFLVIAIAVEFVMLGRLVKSQRMQIGILKALGLTSRQIIGHYMGYTIIIGMLGTVAGIIAGLGFARYLTGVYLTFYALPQYPFSISWMTIGQSAALGIGAGVAAGWLASRRIVFISPAESMREEAPTNGRRVIFEEWRTFWNQVDSAWKMTLRGIARHRMRFWITVTGVACAVGLLMVSMFINDSLNHARQQAFYVDRSFDLLARFSLPMAASEAKQIAIRPGVLDCEPFLEVPVRLSRGGAYSDVIMQGFGFGAAMASFTDTENGLLSVPASGLIISEKTAQKLGVQKGDEVMVETKLGLGKKYYSRHRISGISKQVAGKTGAASLDSVNRMLEEHNLITGVMLQVDRRGPALEQYLAGIARIEDVINREKELANFDVNLNRLKVTMLILTAFAILLGSAIIYNSSVMSLGERLRELAVFKVIGMKNAEIVQLMGNEVLLQLGLGLLAGIPLGRLLAEGVARLISSEVFQMAPILYLPTYAATVLLTVLFVAAGFGVAVRSVQKLDFLDVLKNRN
ncbi:MAG: ABC transporter permease [Solirubrobacterales bacterium]